LEGGLFVEPSNDRWGLTVAPGEHALACAHIGEFDPELRYEGLWVFHGSAVSENLEQWMSALHRMDTGSGVEFEQAWARLTTPIVVRGGRIDNTSQDDVAAAFRSLTRANLLGEDDWPLAEPKPFRIMCRVAEATDT
jgi:hypothetical protein